MNWINLSQEGTKLRDIFEQGNEISGCIKT
jgi:predicted RNA-binding protein